MNNQELEQWKKSEDLIDARIDKILSEKGWDILLPKGLDNQDRMKAFYEHVMYVVNSFLEEDETRELFIQLPTEELANRDSKGEDAKQVKRFRWLNGTIAACLQMATIEQLRNNLFVSKETDYNNTINRYHVGDYFLAKKHDGGYYYVDTIGNDDHHSRLRFYNSQNGKLQGNPREAFDDCVSGFFVRISKIPAQLRNGINQICNAIDTVNKTPNISKRFQSAAFVSTGAYSPLNERVITDNSLFNLPFKFFSDYLSAISYNPEIIIVCGDPRYLKVAQAYRNSDAKKIIYIGSEAPFERIKTYPFTFREIYRYSSLRMSFTEPTMNTLTFPWLEERQRELEVVLDDCMKNDEDFSEEDRNCVLRNLICSLSRYDFDANQLKRIKEKYSEDNIDEEFNLSIDVSDNTIAKISSWIQSLEFDDVNPKANWINSQKATLILGKNSSYRNNVKRLCGYSNKIVADNLTDSNKDKRYPYILRYHLFANIIALYYKNENYALRKLQKYIDKEIEYYAVDYRKALGTDISIGISQPVEELPGWLDKFFDEEYNINVSISTQSDKCYVTFEDGTNDIVDGEVIADLGEDGYDTINIREAGKGMEISYYHTPKNLDELIAACEEYKERWNMVSKYSNLWKDKFKEAYNSKISQGISREEAIKAICDASGLKKEIVKSYTKEYDSRFLRSKKEMRKALNYLESLHLISEDDKKKVMLAKYHSSISLKFGTILKKELYDSFMNDSNSSLLDEISKNSGLSKNAIFESTIVTNKIIKSIKIVNNNE